MWSLIGDVPAWSRPNALLGAICEGCLEDDAKLQSLGGACFLLTIRGVEVSGLFSKMLTRVGLRQRVRQRTRFERSLRLGSGSLAGF
jgi:hypothetical protein